MGVSKIVGASTVYWDSDGSTSGDTVTGTNTGGTGTWDTTSPLWWNGVLATDQAWNNANFDFATFSGTAGTVTLGTSVSAGGLTFNTTGYTVAGSSTLTLGGASTPFISVASGLTATISAPLAGTAGFNANGLGTLILSGNNSGLTGGITISSGTVTAASANALGANAVTLGSTTGSNAASLLVNTNGLSFSNAITLATNASTGTLTIGNTGTAISTTFTGGVTGTNNFTINESGTTGGITFSNNPINNSGTVTNAGSGTGTTTIAGGIGSNVTGIIQASNTSPLTISTTSLTVNSGGTTLTNNAASGTTALITVSGGVDGTGNLILSNNNSSITNGIQLTTTTINNAGAIINQGTGTSGVLISAPVGSNVTGITQNSPGSTLTLSSTASTFAGPITVNAGTLSLTGSLNSGSAGALAVGGGTFSYAPTIASSTQSVSGVTINAGGSGINASNGNTLALGTLTRNAGGTVAFNPTTAGTISTSATNTNNILGPWATFGSGTSLAYATVSGGNLAAYAYGGAGDSSITDPAAVIATDGATNYTLNAPADGTTGVNASIDTLRSTSGARSVTPNSTGGLTLNGLMNAGTGTLTITGSGGILNIGAGAAPYLNELVLTTNNQALIVNTVISGTGTVTIDPTSTGAITLVTVNNTGPIINAGTGTGTTTITLVGPNVTGITETGASPLTITNPVTPTASLNTFINNGSAALTLTGGIAAAAQNVVFNANYRGAISVGNIASTGTITNSGTGTATTTITGTVASTITTITENSTSSPLTISGGLTVAAGGTTLINSNASGSAIFTQSGAIGGTGNLILQNNSAIGANTVGATTGGLTVGAINNTGTVTSSGVGSGTTVITGIIGTAVTGVTIGGTSPVILEGVNTYTSATTINSGATLQLGNQSTNNQILVTGTTIANNGTLIFAPGTTALTYANVINGNGNITLNGAAAGGPANITLSATTGTFSGTYTLNQGRISISAQANLGSSTAPITVNGSSSALTGGQLFVTAGVAIANPITINGYGPTEGTGNLGAMRLNVSGASYTGTIALAGNASINTQAATATLTSTAIISGGNTAQLMIGTPITGTGLGNNGAGTGILTIQSTNTYTGGTVISGEIAALGAVGALGTGAVQVGISSTQTSSGLTESVANALTGTNSLTVNAGTVTLSLANNYTGGTIVNNGTLTITGAAGVGTGTLTVNGGTLNANVAGALGSVNLNQTGGTVAESLANAFNGLIALNLSGGVTNLSFANSYTGGATISGTNVTNISAALALSGATTVQSGGTLSSSLATASASGGTITLNSGGILTSAAAGGAFQNVLLNSGSIVNPGGVGSVGTGLLTLTNLQANTGSTLQFDFVSASSFDQLSVAGSYAFGSGINLGLTSFGQLPTIPGTYALMQFSGSVPGTSNFVLPTAPSGEGYALSISGNTINLIISGSYSAISAGWLPTASSSFSWNTAGNWSGGAIPHLTGDTATFATALAGAQTVTLDGQQHVGTLTLNPSTAFGYTLNTGTAGSGVYLDNGASAATLQNLAQSNTIAANVTLVSSNTNVTVATGSTLNLTGTIAGTGKLTLASGNGTLNLNGTGAWTGGTEIDSGTVAINATGGTASQINNAGVGTTTLNGGTLTFTATTGQTTPPSGFALVIGASGGTLNVAGSGTNGKLLTTSLAPNWLTGSGTLTKTGGGDWQTNQPNIGFTGNIVMNGLVEVQNTATLGFGTTTGFNGGTLTVGASGEVVAGGSNVQIFNPVTLAGGILSANGGPDIFNSTANVTATSTLAARLFQTPATSQNFAIGGLSGSGNLSVIGGTTLTNAPGLVTVGNASAYTGTITVGTNGAIGIGNSNVGGVFTNFFGSNNAISVSTVSSAVGLVSDGTTSTGTSTPEVINFTLPANAINFVASNTGGYMVGHIGATTQFNQAVNKTIKITDVSGTPVALPYNGTNSLNVTPLNGYGLLLAAQPAMSGVTGFNVGGVTTTTQASNVIPGLTLQNLSSLGPTGIVKTGTGTLLLNGGNNTFGGAGAMIDIQSGVVAVATDADFGNSSNTIRINNLTAGAAGLLIEGTFGSSRTINLLLANALIGVSAGNTFTLNSGLSYAAVGNTFSKNEDGTLILTTAATGAPTSGTTVTAGTLQISNSNQIGSGAITNASTGAAIQLAGGGTFTQAIALSSVGISSTVGGLTNLSGATTLNGTITINGGSLITNQDAINTFTLGAIANTTTGFNVAGPGNVTISGTISGNGVVQAMGPGVLRITSAITGGGALNTFGGQITLSGTAAQGSGGIGIGYGGTLTFDNATAANVNNRNNNHTLGMSTGGGATLNVIGNASASTTETFLAVNYGRGENVIQLSPNAAQSITVNLTNTGGSFTRGTLSSVVYRAPGLGSAAAAGVGVINEGTIANTGFQGAFVTGGQANQQIQPWALAYDTNNPTSAITFATASAATGANYRPLTASEVTNALVNFQGYAGSSVGTATLNSTTAVTVTGSTAGLFVGESVSGSGIPAGTYITALGAGTITLSVAATATNSGVVLTYGTTGTNVTLTSAGSLNGNTGGNAGTLSAGVNSLTLATGGSLSLASTQTLTLGGSAGGGILATDTASGNVISGGGIITAGINELDIHTVGNLTINSAITGGAGGTGVGLTKGEAGTLTLGTNAFYAGQTVVNAGTLKLGAGNNTIQFSNYMTVGANATLDLNGSSQIVTDLLTDASGVLSGVGIVGASSAVVNGAAGTSTLVIREDASRTYTGTITGGLSAAFSASAASIVKTLTQNETYTGATLINGASVTLVNNGAFSNTNSLTINRASLVLDNTGSADSSSRLPSALPISLGGGTLSYIGRTQFLSAETLGAVSATEGANTINATVQTTGVAGATLTLASVTRALGSTVNYTNTGGTLGTIGTNPQILLTAAPTLQNNIIDGGTVVNGTDFASYNATYGVGALGTAGFAGYSPYMLNNGGATDNISMASNTNVALNNETINSLRITASTSIAFNTSQTLTIATGGLLITANPTIGSTINNGTLASGGSEFFLYNTGAPTINSAIAGTGMALVKSGSGTATIAGTNTYTGGTYVDQGTLTVANSGNVTTGYSTLGTGGIFLNGGNLTQTAGGVIPSQAATIRGGSTLTLSSSLSSTGTTTTGSATITVASTNGIAVGQLVSGTGIPAGEFVTAVNPATNQVTITTGTNVAAGTGVTLNFLVNNSLSGLIFNNNGGTSAPTVAVTGLLNLPAGAIIASSNNVGTTSTLSGGNVDLGNVATPTITVSPITFNGQNVAPLQPTLIISSVLQNANNAVSVAGGGNLQLSGASTFTGGVTLANGTSLTVGLSSTNMANGRPLTGPLGTGTFTIGTGSTLLSTGTFTVGNSTVVTGNFTFDAPSSTAASLTIGAGSQTIALPAASATTITVNAPNMTGGFGATVTGSGSSIIKNGLGTLLLTNGVGASSTFSGGVFLNAGTLLATGTAGTATTAALGTGPVTISGGLLALRNNGVANGSVITYGNNVRINTALLNAYIDINNNGANTGNTIVMGTLDYGTVSGTVFTSTVAGNAAPGTILNITGGNGYKLQFTGTTLTGATSSPTFNIASGLTLILPGGFNVATNLPTNIGAGTLIYSGNNIGATATPISGTVSVAPFAAQSSTPLGTGPITLNSGSTLQISPLYSSAVNTTGYTSGGATAKYFFTAQTSMPSAPNFGIAPNSQLAGVFPADSLLRQAPVSVNIAGLTTSITVYQTLLTVTTGGTYYFGAGTDDQYQIVVDGQAVESQTSGGQALNQLALGSVNLAAGTHTITVRQFNNSGGGGSFLVYSGPDTASNNITGQPPVNNLQAIPLSALSYATTYTAGNGYQNAAILNNAITVAASGSATIDGNGTDFNYAIPSLTLASGATLVAANGTGAAGSMGNGAFIVTGTTNVSAGGGVLSPTTGTLVLAGGVTDGSAGLTKTGAGNLILGASAGTFTGAFNISGGFVQLAAPNALTTGTTTIGVATTTPATLDLNGQTVTTTGNIILNGGAGPASKSSNTPAGLYNSSATTASLPAGGTLSIGAATASVNASVGGFGDIILNGVVQDFVGGSALDKVGPDNLTLNGTNTFTGVLNIKGGKVILGNSSALGDVAGATVLLSGAALDLNGQTIGAEPVTLTGTGVTGVAAPNTLGSLINGSLTNASLAGAVTLSAATSIGSAVLSGTPTGSITLSGAVTGAQIITKVGSNNLTLTNAGNAITDIDIQSGSVTLSGAGKVGDTGPGIVRQGTTLTLDNSGTATSNRWFAGGSFITGNVIISGNSGTAVSEVVSIGSNNMNIGAANGVGQATITLNATGTSSVTLQVASTQTSIFSRGASSTALLRGDGLGTGTTAAAANTAYILGSSTSLGLSQNNTQSVGQTGQWNAPNALIYQWAVADTSASGVGTGFASYSTFGGTLNFGTANTGGVAPLSLNANNALSAAPALSLVNVNTTNGNATVTTASTAGLAVGQLVNGTGIPANAVITSLINATSFTISANATATANNTLTVYANPTTTISNITTTASTTVTVPSTANLYVGEVVAGVNGSGVATGFIPNGDTIASITDATHFVLTTTATAGTNASLIFGLPGYANIAAGSAQTFGTSTVAQEQNSLTLTSGGSASITTGLQLDSGGILAVGTDGAPDTTTYTIGGTGMLTGTNTLNRELVFHVTGTGTTLTVNAPIFVNGGSGAGLTKADGGTLVLGAQETYTGNTALNGGITRLGTGLGANPIFTVYSTAPTPGNAATGVSGQLFYVNSGATFDLNGNNQAVSDLLSGSGTQLAGGTIINSTGTATLHIAPNVGLTWAGNISNSGAGTLNFVRDGTNTFTVNSPNTLSGTVTLTGGLTTLFDLGTFQNASAINITRSALSWNDTGVQAVSNRLSPTAPITLTGGGFQFASRAGSGANPVDAISLGTLNLGIGESSIIQTTVSQGSASQITFAGLGTRATGATLTFGSAANALGYNPYIFFTSAPTVTNGLIGAWATVNSLASSSGTTNASFATYSSAAGVTGLQYQPTNTYGSGVNTLINGSTTIPAPLNTATTTTVNSLTIYAASTLSFQNAGDTLVIQSGGIISGTDANNKVIGSTATPGRIQSGAGQDLYIHVGSTTTNSLTINSKIIDNGSNNNVIIDGFSLANSAVLTLTNSNTYGGTTYLSGVNLSLNSSVGPAIPGDIVLSGGNSSATDSLLDSQTQLSFSQSNQLVSTANVTMNGATRINLGNGSNGSVSNSQTINNLTINNDGGSNTADGPTIFTGAGTLTINGTLTASNSETFTIPTLNGFYNLTTGNIVVNPNTYVPNQVGLAIEGNITASQINLSGGGYLGIGGQSSNFTGPVNVNAGGLAFSPTTGTVGVILGGQVVLAAGTTFDTRGLSGVIGSLASSQASSSVINGLQGTAGTLITGLDNTSSTFAGTISSPFPTGLLNFTKIGNGVLTLTGNSTATNNGTLTLSGGGITVSGASGAISFTTTSVQTGGTLLVDDSTNALNNRLGGAVLSATAAVLAPTYRTLNIQGGSITVTGNSSVAVSEALGNIAAINGGNITLNATGTNGVNLTIGQIVNQGNSTSLLIRGDGLGNAAGAGVATVKLATVTGLLNTPGLVFPGTQGGGANNNTNKSIRSDILVDNSATGFGAGFLTIDSATGLVRPLGFGSGITFSSELAPTLTTATSATTNVALNSVAFGYTTNAPVAGAESSNLTANSLTLQSGGGVNLGIIASNPWGANGGLLTMNLQNSGALLALASSGSTSITAGQYQSNASVTLDFHVLPTATMTLNSIINSGNGWVKGDGGTLVLNGAYYTNGGGANTVTINGGTVQFGAGIGTNVLFVQPTATTPSATALALNNGTLDLNGNSQLVGALTSTNPLPYGGGTAGSPNIIISNSSGTPATFSTNAAASVFSGELTGNLSLDKSGNTTMSLSSPQLYTGTTTIRGGNLTLRDQGSIASSAALNVNFAELILDNSAFAENTSRVNSSAALNFNGGALRINTSERVDTENFGTLNLNGGANLLYINQYSNNGNGSSPTLNFANLTESNSGSLLIEAPFSTALGNFTAANTHIYLSQLNGAPFNASSMVNGIIAPWMVVTNTATGTGSVVEWATYSNTAGITTPNQNGAPNYSTNALTAGIATDNISATGTVLGVTGRTINTLAVRNPAAATAIGMNAPTDQLVVAGGGILINDSQLKGVTIQGGSLTAGLLNQASTLYLHNFTGTTTINSPIVNNGTGALSFVRTGNGTVTITPEVTETFTFAASAPSTTTLTVPNASALTIGMGVSGSSLIPSNTFITAIAGNVITLSNSTTANGTTASTVQLLFAPVTSSSATGSTTAGSNTVSILAANLPAGFVPAIGMVLGSSVNLPGGATITGISLGTTDTFTLSVNATTTSSTATLVFGASSNTYTGTTTVNATTDQFAGGTTNLSGLPGAVVVPGNLVINGGATVTMVTNQGQIAATSNVTLNGSGTLNLVGTNTLNSVAFNNSGGNATPTLATATLLNLSSATPITAQNDNTAFTPTISGTALNLTSVTGATITTSGLSADDLIISAPITSTGTITKAGAGSLVLPNANAAVLAWNLAAGSLIVNNATALGAAGSTLAISGNGTLLGGTAAQTISLPITFLSSANLSLGGTSAVNQVTLAGSVNLNGMAPTFTVAAQPTTDAITGQITGTGGFTKAGAGALTLTPAIASTFTGSITVSGGLLTMGNVNAFGAAGNAGADYTVATAAEINLNAFALSMGSLSGGGIVTNSGAAAALTIGAGSNTNSTTFSGSLAAATVANLSVIKVGNTNLTLTGQSYYTGVTTLTGGTITLKNSSASATTPTLANTAITVAALQTLAVSASGSPTTTVNIGNNVTSASGASLTLSPGTGATAGANFTMADSLIDTFNIIEGATAGTGLTIGGAGTLTTNAPTMTFDISSTNNVTDLLAVTRAAAVGASGGVFAFNVLGSNLTPGNTYTFITASSGLADAKLTLANSGNINAGGHTYAGSLATSTATAEILTIVAQTSTLANAYWDGAQSGSWNTYNLGATNWSSTQASITEAGVLPAFNTNVFFTVNNPPGAGNLSTTLGENFTINSLNFLGTGTSATNPITIAGNNLTINAGTANGNTAGNGINVAAGTGAVTINSNVVLASSQIWTTNSGNSVTVNGNISSSVTGFSLTKEGSGTLVLNGNNSYDGGTTLNGGVTQISSNTSLGATSGVAVINNATLEATANITTSRNFQLGHANSTIQVDSGVTYQINGTVNDNGANVGTLNKTGPGVLILTAAEGYTGGTNVIGGKVVASVSLNGAVNVSSGATFASGNNFTTQIGALTATSDAAGGGTVAPGDTGGSTDLSTVGQLNSTGSVILGTASTVGVAHLTMEIGGNNDGTGGGNNTGPLQYDRLTLTGTLSITNVNLDISTVNSSQNFAFANPTSGFNGHIYFLITGATSVTGAFANDSGSAAPNFPGFTSFFSGGQEFAISYQASFTGNSFTGGNDVAIMAIPEPNSVAMLGASVGLSLGLQRFRRRRK